MVPNCPTVMVMPAEAPDPRCGPQARDHGSKPASFTTEPDRTPFLGDDGAGVALELPAVAQAAGAWW